METSHCQSQSLNKKFSSAFDLNEWKPMETAPDWKEKAILHTNLFSTDLRLEKKVMIDLRIDYLMSG